jgi:hypothetical protein
MAISLILCKDIEGSTEDQTVGEGEIEEIANQPKRQVLAGIFYLTIHLPSRGNLDEICF